MTIGSEVTERPAEVPRREDGMGPRSPRIEIQPSGAAQGSMMIVRGASFAICPLTIQVDGKVMRPIRLAEGHSVSSDSLLQAPDGSFVAVIATDDLEPGEHEAVAISLGSQQTHEAGARFQLLERNDERQLDPNAPGGPTIQEDGRRGRETPVVGRGEKPHERAKEFFQRRFGHLGFVPPGTRETQIEDVRRLRRERDAHRKDHPPSDQPEAAEAGMPQLGVCNWTPAGPATVALPSVRSWSGRTLALAIHPTTTSTVYVGTAGGGVWKSTDSGESWSPKTDYQRSLAIGALAIDPINPDRVFAGSGEYNNQGWGQLYGNGVFRSLDGGETWTELGVSTFTRDEISRIVFDPTDATSQRMFIASATGVYASVDGGLNWTRLRAGMVSALEIIEGTGAMPRPITLFAGFAGSGIWTATRTGTTWSAWTQVASAAFPATIGRIAMGQCRTKPKNLFAAFEHLAGLAGMASSSDGGATWTAIVGPASGQAWYNFVVEVHPTDQDTVLYGEIGFWRTTNGGATWSPVGGGLHTDQHAIAFDPSNPTIVWAGCDGGVYRSTSGGSIFESKNRDLATMQYFSLALHPQYEGVMIGGTQDNGVHRTLTSPVWNLVEGGDGGFAAIDPNLPTRMYHGSNGMTVFRSDSAGAAGTWTSKIGAITGNSVAYPPFEMDAASIGVCYFGTDRLWRSADNADSWAAITNVLAGSITAIAVHPTDSNTAYAGTNTGRVYRVQRIGATWNLADVTTTDITGTGLPPLYVSDLAVDTVGTVWASFAAVLWAEPNGEFTNDHVYRRTATATGWELRSTGLARANPINSIVIDPTNNSRLFCGGDLSVFRSDDAGATWTPWDEGLPNAAVFKLAIHGPRRLLRAATHGRSIWERPIDVASCPMVDLYFRDTDVDSGRLQPTPSVPHPFNPSTMLFWWQSPDIKVDGPEPGYQTPAPIANYLSYEWLLHRSARRGNVNRFYLQVHNRGVSRATGVQIRAFFANASLGLPALPADFWSAGKPFSADPSGTAWLPIGPAKTIAVLEPGEPGVLEWDWTVPTSAAQHSCLLVVATCVEDPINGAGVFDIGTLITTRKHAALKNLHVADPVPGQGMQPEQAFFVEAHNAAPECNPFELVLHWGSLPKDARVFVAFEKAMPDRAQISEPRGGNRDLAVLPTDEGRHRFAPEYEVGCGRRRPIDFGRGYTLSRPKDATSRLPMLQLEAGASLGLAINVELPAGADTAAQFDIVQMAGLQVVGGSTFQLRPRKD